MADGCVPQFAPARMKIVLEIFLPLRIKYFKYPRPKLSIQENTEKLVILTKEYFDC